MTSIHIKNGKVVDPSQGIEEVRDLFIKDGKIVEGLTESPDQIIDATGLWVAPGFIDVHVHLREPGQEHKETIETGVRAAAAGGFTTVVPMPNTDPVTDNMEVVRSIMDKAKGIGSTKVVPAPAITVGRLGEQLVDFESFVKEGITAFTDDGSGVQRDALMEDAFKKSAKLNIILAQHAEFSDLSKGGAVHEGEVSKALGISGQPIESEVKMVARDIELLKKVGGRLHVSHISAKESVELVRRAKAEGLQVTAEVTPHHLHLTDEILPETGTIGKVAPPLRPMEHVEACRKGLADGTIDVVATDHAPHTIEDKAGDFDKAAFGMVGLEIAVPMLLKLVEDGIITPSRMVDAMSCQPARIFGFSGGTLALNAPADVVLINPKQPFVVDPRTFQSKGRNTPFAGVSVPGKSVLTIVDGNVVFDELSSN